MSERTVVVGGGLTGLSAAFELSSHGADVILLEASDRLGGYVGSSAVGGIVVDSGADGFLARKPEAAELCRSLGLGDQLVSPVTAKAYIWATDKLRPIPAPSVLGVPLDPDKVAASGIVSTAGVDDLRAGLGAPHEPLERDATVGDVLRPRIGNEVFDRMVDPLLGGINAGSADAMSIAANAEQLFDAARIGGTLSRALETIATESAKLSGPVFQGVRGGLGRLVDSLADRLVENVELATPATGIARNSSGWSVATADGVINAPRVILATQASTTAALIEPHCPDAASTIAAIAYSDVAMVTFVVPRDQIENPMDGSGFLVPRDQGLVMTACSWSSSKWQHYHHDDIAILRVSAGRSDDRRWLDMSSSELVEVLTAELGTTIGMEGSVHDASVRVSQMRGSLPQYTPGHLDRIDEVDAVLAADAPGLLATGAAFRGLGLPACVRQGREAAWRSG